MKKPDEQIMIPLALAKPGTGKGTVSGFGINCGRECNVTAVNYKRGASVTLAQRAETGSKFSGWGGDCGGSGLCRLVMDSPKKVSANFSALNYILSAKVINNGGTGRIIGVSAAGGCDSECQKDFPIGSLVALNASAGENSFFSGWGGACSGSGRKICLVKMDQSKSVSAAFSKANKTYKMSVSKSGGGTGTIQSFNISGIDCGISCSANFVSDSFVTLAATSDSGSEFAGWSGDTCQGKNTECRVKADKNKEIKAAFNKK